MEKLSVIIPVYNTKNELVECLNSICNQTYRNLEIICVDDGSTDGSEKIVDYYARKDSRIHVIHQENAGESNARNRGLQVATGDYITFCDCDDWLDNDMYETMMGVIRQDHLDMMCVSRYEDDGIQSKEIKNIKTVTKEVFGQEQLLEYLYIRDHYRGFAYIWDKIYKKSILERQDGKSIVFDENIKLGADAIFLAEVSLNANRIKYIDRCFYHYRIREKSGCHVKDLSKKNDWIQSYKIIIELFQMNEVDKRILDYVKRFMVYHCTNFVEIAVEQNEVQIKKEFQEIMKEYEKEYIELNYEYPDRIERFNKLLVI